MNAICWRIAIAMSIAAIVQGSLIFYGNEVVQRQSGGLPSLMDGGGRMYVDDPLKCINCPDWGFLTSFLLYIDANPIQRPSLQLQIWSTEKVLRKYTLKMSLAFNFYQPGRLYNVSVPLNDRGFPIEVNSNDRIGFTHGANFTPISLTIEKEDNVTETTAHRTYYHLLESNNNQLPSVGQTFRFSNYALRAKFSIGVLLNDVPPLNTSEQYIGAKLKNYTNTLDSNNTIILDSLILPTGKISAVFFRLKTAQDIQLPVDICIWKKASAKEYELVYFETKIVSISNTFDDPYIKIAFTNGPTVDNTIRLGFRIKQINLLYYTINPNTAAVYSLADSDAVLKTGGVYKIDNLRQYYEFSLGVAVSQAIKNSTFFALLWIISTVHLIEL